MMCTTRHGVALVVCAPSGTGKTTLVKRLLGDFLGFAYSVSYTTRQARQGEVDGKDYHFVDRATFDRLREADFFAEWAEVHGNCYGTPLKPVQDLLAAGKDLLFDIDVQGARQLRGKLEGLFVFILPPSREVLEKRLSGRGTDDVQTIARRMKNAGAELRAADDFDVWIVNNDLEEAYQQLRAAFVAETLRPRYRPNLAAQLLVGWPE